MHCSIGTLLLNSLPQPMVTICEKQMRRSQSGCLRLCLQDDRSTRSPAWHRVRTLEKYQSRLSTRKSKCSSRIYKNGEPSVIWTTSLLPETLQLISLTNTRLTNPNDNAFNAYSFSIYQPFRSACHYFCDTMSSASSSRSGICKSSLLNLKLESIS